MDRNIVKHFEVLENINKAINELKLKYGNKIFDNIGKTHFKNLKK